MNQSHRITAQAVAAAASSVIGIAAAEPLQFEPAKPDRTMTLESRDGCEQLYARNCSGERNRLSFSFGDATGKTFVAVERVGSERMSHSSFGERKIEAEGYGHAGIDTAWNAAMQMSRLELGRAFRLGQGNTSQFRVSAVLGRAEGQASALANFTGRVLPTTVKIPNTTTPAIDTTRLHERGIPELGIAPGVIPAMTIAPRDIRGRDVDIPALSASWQDGEQKQASSAYGMVRQSMGFDIPTGDRSRVLLRQFANAGYEYSNAGIGIGFAVSNRSLAQATQNLDHGTGGSAYSSKKGLTFSYQLQGMRVVHDRLYSKAEAATDRFAAHERDRLVSTMERIDDPRMQAAMPQIRRAASNLDGQMIRDQIELYDPRGRTHLTHNLGLDWAIGNGANLSVWHRRDANAGPHGIKTRNTGVSYSVSF